MVGHYTPCVREGGINRNRFKGIRQAYKFYNGCDALDETGVDSY